MRPRFHSRSRRSLILGGGIALAFLGTSPALADPRFDVPVFELGREPSFLVTADFNRDGRLDLAVTNSDSRENCVAVLLGREAGFFGPPTCYPVGARPLSMVDADFNRDGVLDLAVGDPDSNDVAVLLGNGDGTFRAGGRFPAQNPISIATGDFDGDGSPDLAVVSDEYFGSPPGLSVLRGAADGTFGQALAISVGGGPQRIVSGDFDRDGLSDLALTDYTTDEVGIYLGDPGAMLTLRSSLQAGGDPREIVAADLDADGVPDLVVANVLSADLSIFLGRGHGSFSAAPRIAVGVFPNYPYYLAGGDFDADGRIDLAVSMPGAVETSILLGDGAGGFRRAHPIRRFTGRSVAGDFSGDGIQDLASLTGTDVSIFRGFGEGSFKQVTRFDADQSFYSTVTGDFNGDGRPDVAAADEFENSIHVFLGRGDGSFAGPGRWTIGGSVYLLATGDFNGDGRDDIAALGSGPARVLLATPDGSFGPPSEAFDIGVSPQTAIASDFNGDGRLDLAVCNGGVFGDPQGYVSILLGAGDGTFAGRVQFPAGDWPQWVVAGDFNADGRQDLALSNRNVSLFAPGSVSILLGRGDGGFAAPLQFPVGVQPAYLAAGDLNGDGILDLAVPNGQVFANDPGDASVLLGRGDGTFAAEIRLPAGFFPFAALIGDFDADGRADLAVVNGDSADVAIFLTREDGSFAPAETYSSGLPAWSAITADFNGDGRPDLVMGHRSNAVPGNGGLSILLDRPPFPCRVPPGGDPAMCTQAVTDVRIDYSHTLGRGAGLLAWITTHEFDLAGFNLIIIDRDGNRIPQNGVLIPCGECITGVGTTYSFPVPKHKSGRDLFVEMVRSDGTVQRFGPALRE